MIRALSAVIAALSLAGPAGARSAALDVAAAITLAEAGIAQADAALIVTALEILSDHDPGGPASEDLRDMYLAEARFLLRGDGELSARLAAVDTSVPAGGPVLILPYSAKIAAVGTTGRIEVTVAGNAVLHAVRTSAGGSCERRMRLWACPAGKGGLRLDAQVSGPAWIVMDLAPGAP